MRRNVDGYKVAVAVLVGMMLVLFVGLAAQAHSDGGTDEPWTVAMNQESFWENRFGPGTECTKYEDHNGFIPSQYEAAVSKGGTQVRVYEDPPAWITGPHKDNGKHREISWVMKCDITTTTTSSTSTTEATTTTTEASTTTTSTLPPTTATTSPSTTVPTPTTTLGTTTSTSVPTSTSTTTPVPTTTAHTPTEWTAEAVCDPTGIHLDFDPTTMTIDGYFYVEGIDNDGWRHTFTADTPGTYTTGPTDFTMHWRLVAKPLEGVAAHPAEIRLEVPACEASSTSLPDAPTETPDTTETPDPGTPAAELPHTGAETPLLAALGLILVASGGYVLRRLRVVS